MFYSSLSHKKTGQILLFDFFLLDSLKIKRTTLPTHFCNKQCMKSTLLCEFFKTMLREENIPPWIFIKRLLSFLIKSVTVGCLIDTVWEALRASSEVFLNQKPTFKYFKSRCLYSFDLMFYKESLFVGFLKLLSTPLNYLLCRHFWNYLSIKREKKIILKMAAK